ncbi:cytochrome P450 [Parasphingorhabdus halotolerans]|uniref:Cytochrome P450 n=1 Tax=Parasphingorhabdus halotolerans TaxID=2725558 RepID=A0A6H2DNC1_9SPHN|nr:cytochrome P450 [Parasphingorhabdus halotolerans]QJB69455.1 cytochrome P450 [Parasphingorhabdus halotolerans]
MATQLDQKVTDAIDPSVRERFVDGSVHDVMRQLRKEAPIHHCADSPYGPYWSITKHRDIIEIEALPAIFSSEGARGGISILDQSAAIDQMSMETFIAMDPPRHTAKRRTVSPAFTPSEMTRLSDEIRQRTSDLLDELPRNEEFNWVERVSVPLTTDMLAILFNYPWEERHKLITWSDAITSFDMIENLPEERMALIFEMVTAFHQLWDLRSKSEQTPDLLSMMIHSDALGKMDAQEFLGNMALLIVGGNDTTRNSMSAIPVAFSQYPDEWAKIQNDESLLPNAASEVIRWQTPVAHMRRTVVADAEFHGHKFREGDKIILWYISANRDEAVFDNADKFIADRENARRHLSFGYGVHRCVGARLAELQIQILLSEMVKRKMSFELEGDIVRANNPFVHGILNVPARIGSN